VTKNPEKPALWLGRREVLFYWVACYVALILSPNGFRKTLRRFRIWEREEHQG